MPQRLDRRADAPPSARIVSRTEGELAAQDDCAWQLLERRAEVLRSFGEGPLSKAHAKRAAEQLGVHWTTAYRWRNRLLEGEVTTALLPRHVGFPGGTRLSAEQEAIVKEVVAARLRRSAKVRLVDLVEEVARRCAKAGMAAPSRGAISRRWMRAKVHAVAPAKPPGALVAEHPLDLVQIDHTVSDVMVVDDLYRQPIGRPYLTVALDVASRCIVAVQLSFDPPGAASVALCLARAAQPKAPWIHALGLDCAWPMTGLPRALHLDNAPEFHSKALQRGCAQFGIELVWRPVKRPHFGGHIERGIGTLMNRFKSLPGATGSNPVDRRGRKPEKAAVMTLDELERWLVIEIADRYHHRPHRGLKEATPHSAWAADPPPSPSAALGDALLWAFLPAVTRRVRPDGVHFHHIRYWHPIFSQWAVSKDDVVLHYDPRDLSQVFVRRSGSTMLAVPYADLRRPTVSIWECAAAARHLRTLGADKIHEARLFAAIETQREIVRGAASRTRRARAEQQRRLHREQVTRGRGDAPAPAASTTSSPIADADTDFAGEVW